MTTLDQKQLRKMATTTYRCPRRCVLGYVVNYAGDVALAHFDGHTWQLEKDPTASVEVACRHITGVLCWSDGDPTNVTVTQDDARSVDPDGKHLSHAEAMQMLPVSEDALKKLFGKE